MNLFLTFTDVHINTPVKYHKFPAAGPNQAIHFYEYFFRLGHQCFKAVEFRSRKVNFFIFKANGMGKFVQR